MKIKILIIALTLSFNFLHSKIELSARKKFYLNEVKTKGPFAILF